MIATAILRVKIKEDKGVRNQIGIGKRWERPAKLGDGRYVAV
jgi:hypothetical protein